METSLLIILLCRDVEKLYATGELNFQEQHHKNSVHSMHFICNINFAVGEMYDESYIRMAPSDSSIKRNWSFTRNRK